MTRSAAHSSLVRGRRCWCPAHAAKEGSAPQFRALLPPLIVITGLVTALALILTAAAMTPPPFPATLASPVRATAVVSTREDAGVPSLAGTPLVRNERAELPSPPVMIGLTRLTYQPHAGGSSQTLPGPVMLAMESGSLTVTLNGSGHLLRATRSTEPATGTVMVQAGDGLMLPGAIAVAVSNDGVAPAVAIVANVFPIPAGHVDPMRWDDTLSPGATVQRLADGLVVDLHTASATMALRRVSLRPGDAVPLLASGPVALAVETGALTMADGQGLIWHQHPDATGAFLTAGTDTTLLPDDGALLQNRAGATLRNDGSGPLLILVLTVVPISGSGALLPRATPILPRPTQGSLPTATPSWSAWGPYSNT